MSDVYSNEAKGSEESEYATYLKEVKKFEEMEDDIYSDEVNENGERLIDAMKEIGVECRRAVLAEKAEKFKKEIAQSKLEKELAQAELDKKEEISDLKREIIELKKENSHLKNIAQDYNLLKEKIGKPVVEADKRVVWDFIKEEGSANNNNVVEADKKVVWNFIKEEGSANNSNVVEADEKVVWDFIKDADGVSFVAGSVADKVLKKVDAVKALDKTTGKVETSEDDIRLRCSAILKEINERARIFTDEYVKNHAKIGDECFDRNCRILLENGYFKVYLEITNNLYCENPYDLLKEYLKILDKLIIGRERYLKNVKSIIEQYGFLNPKL